MQSWVLSVENMGVFTGLRGGFAPMVCKAEYCAPLRTELRLELIVMFSDTFANPAKMSGRFQKQGVKSACTGTIYRSQIPRSALRSIDDDGL